MASMSQPSHRRQLVGKAILVTMLIASFFSLPYVLANTSQTGFPRDFRFAWTAAVALVILFPIMASHIHTMWLFKKIGWLSWWFAVTLASIGLVWLFAQTLGPKQNFHGQNQIVSWFFSCFMGGTLGGLAVFGAIRRFAPSWLGYLKPELPTVKRKLNLQTMFLWVTAVGLMCGAFINRKQFLLVEDHELHFVFWILLGAFNVGLFCLAVFPVVTNWLFRTKPFWLAGFSLVLFCILIPLGLAVWITIASGFYGEESSLVSFTYITFFSCVSLYAVLWIAGCRLSGLIQVPLSDAGSVGIRGFIGRSFSKINWCLKSTGLIAGVGCLIYIAGWLGLHLQNGPERNPKVILDSIFESLGETGRDEDWIDAVNRHSSVGIGKNQNVAVQILRVSNPFTIPLQPDETKPLFDDVNHTVAKYRKELGLSPQAFRDLPTDDYEIWFYARHEEYANELNEKYPLLWDENHFYEPTYEDEEFGDLDTVPDSMENPDDSTKSAQPSADLDRNEILAKFLVYPFEPLESILVLAPWSKSDYPVGAEFLALQKPKIEQYREISKGEYFYSPLIRNNVGTILTLDSKLTESASYLLQASGYFNIGSDRIDEAIEDCKSIARLASLRTKVPSIRQAQQAIYLQRPATRLALGIAYSQHASREQIQTVIRLIQSQQDTKTRMESDQTLFAAKIKDSVYRNVPQHLEPNLTSGNTGQHGAMDGPIYSTYRVFPNLVDWEALITELDKNIDYAIETSRLAAAGEITIDEFQQRTWETCCVKLANGRYMGKEVHSSVFGNQFLTFASDPKAKGKMLASLEMHQLEFYGIYSARANRAMTETALALRLYQKSNGTFPKSLPELVPDFLPDLTLDPFSGESFIYKTDGNTFKLYSSGRNQVDDGGDEMSDIVFEMPYSDLVDYIERNQGK